MVMVVVGCSWGLGATNFVPATANCLQIPKYDINVVAHTATDPATTNQVHANDERLWHY